MELNIKFVRFDAFVIEVEMPGVGICGVAHKCISEPCEMARCQDSSTRKVILSE